jgi:hypothetical protein
MPDRYTLRAKLYREKVWTSGDRWVLCNAKGEPRIIAGFPSLYDSLEEAETTRLHKTDRFLPCSVDIRIREE